MILAESEFKAVAAYQLGYPALGIPGISSFIGKHFDRLWQTIARLRPGKIVIIFDDEIKNDPRLPSYKADFTKRWDTPWRAWQYAQRFMETWKERTDQEGVGADAESYTAAQPEWGKFEVRIGVLPPNYHDRVTGKVDIDGALARGMTSKEFQGIVETALHPAKYVRSLPVEGRWLVQRLIDKQFLEQRHIRPVSTPLGYSYISWRKTRDGLVGTKQHVSNLIIHAKHDTKGPDGYKRIVTFEHAGSHSLKVVSTGLIMVTGL